MVFKPLTQIIQTQNGLSRKYDRYININKNLFFLNYFQFVNMYKLYITSKK